MSGHVYKLLELTGSSTVDIEDAVRTAIAKASESVRHIHWFEVTETRGHVVEGKVAHWQVDAEGRLHARIGEIGVPDRRPALRISMPRRRARPCLSRR
jgi:flavin-binding protein dodecin